MSTKLIDLQHISKSYDGQVILDDMSLYIRENEFLTLLGPSGCGKTTTLRIIGGFEIPDAGRVIFDGQDITSLAPQQAAVKHSVPALRPVSSYDHCGKHRFWPEDQEKK